MLPGYPKFFLHCPLVLFLYTCEEVQSSAEIGPPPTQESGPDLQLGYDKTHIFAGQRQNPTETGNSLIKFQRTSNTLTTKLVTLNITV